MQHEQEKWMEIKQMMQGGGQKKEYKSHMGDRRG